MTETTAQAAPLLPHQQRVVAERAELRERLDKLGVFVNGATFPNVDYAEQNRLLRQQNLMMELLDVLDERIAAFAPGPAA